MEQKTETASENSQPAVPANSRSDLHPQARSELLWDEANRRKSLSCVYQRAENHALDSIEWYLKAKRGKKICARSLRLGLIGLTAIAGLLPMLSQISTLQLPPVWASVALGLAGVLLAIDKFFGCSSAWMRFIATEHQIRQCLHEFQMDYDLEQTRWTNNLPTSEQTQSMLNRCKAFTSQVDTIIRQETDLWLAEFQDAIKQQDETARIKAAASEPGGINVTVTNGEALTAGWQVSVDSGIQKSCKGRTTAIPGLNPGMHTLRLQGEIGGVRKDAEQIVLVSAGRITDAAFTF